MPRETIWGRVDSNTGQQINTSVLWQRDGMLVQVAVTPTGEEGYYTKADDGYFGDLTRFQVNELIRVLRKARDQAFGKDE